MAFHLRVGFLPQNDLDSTALTYLAVSMFFIVLPLAKKINIAKFFEYEAKIIEVKNDVKEFKEETREMMTIYNNLINTVSNTANQSIVVNVPSQGEVERLREELDSSIDTNKEDKKIEEEIDSYLTDWEGEPNLALAKLRMDIEIELRRILGKRTKTKNPISMREKFLSASSLFREFIRIFPSYNNTVASFDYVLKICNAGIHGQAISEAHFREAMYMGVRMLEEFRSIGDFESLGDALRKPKP